jgi:hypothetical protein
MFAAIALIIALTCPHAKALESSPHWEEIDGINRYGYWQEIYAGYYNENAGYWDYSAGNGHFVTIYSNAVYDDQGNFLGEDSSEVWVPLPEWVSAPLWIPPVTIWVDVTTMPEPESRSHSVDLGIDIRKDNANYMTGDKVWCKVAWELSEEGNTINKSVTSDIYPSELTLMGIPLQFRTGGNIFADGEPTATDAQLRLHGNAWTSIDPLQSGFLLEVFMTSVELTQSVVNKSPLGLMYDVTNANFSPWDINWDMNLNMAYNNYSKPTGSLSGWHDRFPSYRVNVDDSRVYDFLQDSGSTLGVIWYLAQKKDVVASF